MIVPLFYRDESPSATYEFEFIVDSEQQVSESNEGNNHFSVRWWTTRPGSALSTTPFKIEAKSGKVDNAIE
jgi:subtilase family serine protease